MGAWEAEAKGSPFEENGQAIQKGYKMSQYYRGMNSPRQVRGWRKVKPATPEERLESMERELASREQIYGPDHWMTRMQRDIIAKEEQCK